MTLKGLRQAQSANWRISALVKRAEFWVAVVGLLGLGVLFWFVSEQLFALLKQAASARTFVNTFGPLAPLVYISIFALQILIAPFPGQFMGIMSGYLFGPFWGSLYSIVGLAVGAGLAVGIARKYGQPLVERFFEGDQVRQWERKLRMRSPVTWGLLFLFPVPDFVFYVAGLSRVPFRGLLIAVIAGRSVGLIFANVIGYLSATLPPEWVLAKWVVLIVAAAFAYRYQRTIRLLVLLGVRRFQRLGRRWRRLMVAPDKI
jgi:uncharacterized membrane protein YdjX (TVP38/TMEM64 family)